MDLLALTIKIARRKARDLRKTGRKAGWELTAQIGVALDALIDASSIGFQSEADKKLLSMEALGSGPEDTEQLVRDCVDLIQTNTGTVAKFCGSPADRAACGRVLGWLGDSRLGVSVSMPKNGKTVPVFDWKRIEVDEKRRHCELVPGSSGSDTGYLRLRVT